MRWRIVLPLAWALVACRHQPDVAATTGPPLPAAAPAPTPALRGPEAFAAISDPAQRSRALFSEAAKVMLSPRCLNCHPDGDTPAQGDHGRVHDPPVVRGGDDHGVVGMRCATCHQDHNVPLARVPGAPEWHLAPRVMAWVGKKPRALCEQLKDPARNGGKTLAQIADHAAHDKLVAWGWSPGADRTPAPGTQQLFGALIAAWIQDGAACPLTEDTK